MRYSNEMKEHIKKLMYVNKLKSIYRMNSVENRKENSAEHSWSCIILADCFLSEFNYEMDRLKVYGLLMYHDVIEIETGDTPLHPKITQKNKNQHEMNSLPLILHNLPFSIKSKYEQIFQEFEEQKTIESKFTKAIDNIDAMIHELDYLDDWKDYSKEFLIEKKSKIF